MSYMDIIVLSGAVCKVKNTGPSTEPRGTLYEIVTLSVFDICGLVLIFQIMRKPNLILPRYSIPI